MTTQQLIDRLNILIDDNMGDNAALLLLNMAKNEIETERAWRFLTKIDTSQFANPNDNYLSMKALPADFLQVNSYAHLYVGTDTTQYDQIPVEERITWKDYTHVWYIDQANNQFALCGGVSKSGTIFFPYQAATPDLDLAGSNPVIPNNFQMIYVLHAAANFFAVDQGDKARAWDDRWQARYDRLFQSMVAWDMKNQLAAVQNNPYQNNIDYTLYPNIADID